MARNVCPGGRARTLCPAGRPQGGEEAGTGPRGAQAHCCVKPLMPEAAGPSRPLSCSVFLLGTSGRCTKRSPQGEEEQEAPLPSPRRVAPLSPGADDSWAPACDGPGDAVTPLCPRTPWKRAPAVPAACADLLILMNVGSAAGSALRLHASSGGRCCPRPRAGRLCRGRRPQPATEVGWGPQQRRRRAQTIRTKQIVWPHGCLGGNQMPKRT